MKKIVSLFLVLLLSLSMTAAFADESPVIFACPKETTVDYWTFNDMGVEKFGEDAGINVYVNGPDSAADVQTQINMMYDMIEAGVKGICLAANDSTAVEQVVTDAVAKDIVVVTWDTDCVGPRTCLVNFAEDYQLGCAIAESLVKQIGVTEGNVALLTGQLGSSQSIARAQGVRDTFAEKYPELNIVVEMDCDHNQDTAFANAQSILATYDNIVGFATTSGAEVPAAAQAVQQAIDTGLIEAGSCHVAGSMVPSSVYDAIKEGTVITEVLTAHPYQLGYAAAWMCNYLIENDGVMPEVGTVLKVGDDIFGSSLELTVAGENLVLTPTLTVNAENIDNYNF